MKWVGHVACMREVELYKFVVGKPEGKMPLGRPRHTWKDTLQLCIYTFYSQF